MIMLNVLAHIAQGRELSTEKMQGLIDRADVEKFRRVTEVMDAQAARKKPPRDLVFLLWPTQPIGVIEVNIGKAAAMALTVGANLVLFAVLGFAVGSLAKTRGRLLGTYVLVCVLLFLWAFWGAGFSFAHLGGFALVVALLLYAVPFWVLMRASATPQSAYR